MPPSAALSALMDRVLGIVNDAPPEEKMDRFNDACHVLGSLVGGGSISFEEARALGIRLARELRFPTDCVENVVILGIIEGRKHAGTIE